MRRVEEYPFAAFEGIVGFPITSLLAGTPFATATVVSRSRTLAPAPARKFANFLLISKTDECLNTLDFVSRVVQSVSAWRVSISVAVANSRRRRRFRDTAHTHFRLDCRTGEKYKAMYSKHLLVY